MDIVTQKDAILDVVQPLATAGAALHWLRPRSKAPVAKTWSDLPRSSMADLRANYSTGNNVGIRLGAPSETILGYVYLIDLDIREDELADEARAELRSLWPEFETFPTVISGSGGESRHIYFISPRLFRSRKLAKSSTFKMVWDAQKEREVKKNDWEIELFGTGKQAVLPPSIHPDTGLPYRWASALDLSMLDIGVGPVLPPETVEGWGARADTPNGDSDEDDGDWLYSEVRNRPLGLQEDEVARILRNLPDDWADDRDGWLTVGAALHHEFDGSDEGFERWCQWSRQSEKFDEKDQRRVWKSFGNSKNPVRMATLIQAANRNQLDYIEDEADAPAAPPAAETQADDPLAGLLGEVAVAEVLDPILGELLGEVAETGPERRDADSPVQKRKADDEWISNLHANEEGNYKNTLHNLELIVRNDPRFRGICGFNEFLAMPRLVNEPGQFRLVKESPKPVKQLAGPIWRLNDKVNGDDWVDSHEHPIMSIIEAPIRQGGYGISSVPKGKLTAAIDMAARNYTFNPVKDFFTDCYASWDGQKRLETVFIDFLGTPDHPYYREAAIVTFLAIVTRIYEPGHKFDYVPILEGGQGLGKSTFIKTMGQKWFAEMDPRFDDPNRLIESMKGALVLEIPELQGFSRVEVTSLKATVTKTHDRGRLAYMTHSQTFPRQCVFIGSTNESDYLRDQTGNRRFLPIPVSKIDNDGFSKAITQLYGEAVAMYRRLRDAQPYGELPLYLRSDASQSFAKQIQESRRQISVEEEKAGEIAEWLDTPVGSEFEDLDGTQPPEYRNEVCGLQIWVEYYRRDASQYGPRERQTIGRALGHLPGWETAGRFRRPKWGLQRFFKRIEPK